MKDKQDLHQCLRWSLALPLCAALMATAGAQVSVEDAWTERGDVLVRGTVGQVAIRRGDAGVLFERDGQRAVIMPLEFESPERCEVTEQSVGSAKVMVTFGGDGASTEMGLTFGNHGVLRIVPGSGMAGVRFRCPIDVGVLPGVRLEDVLYRAGDFPECDKVYVPTENWFAGLLAGYGGILVCAWTGGNRDLTFVASGEGDARLFGEAALGVEGSELYVGLLAADALWHREVLELGHLEKNVPLEWKPAVQATYRTQLPLRAETTTPRTFEIKRQPNVQFCPEVGACDWPMWMEDGQPILRLSKKIPPKGEAILYPFSDGPKSLMGFLERTPVGKTVQEKNKKAALPHGPRGAANVGFVACGGTAVMRHAIFAPGAQAREKAFLQEYADFLGDYVAIVQNRHRGFLDSVQSLQEELVQWQTDGAATPGTASYLDKMMETSEWVRESLQGKMELFGEDTPEDHIARADRYVVRLKELLETGSPEVYPECDAIIDRCNRLAWGHAERLGMRFSMLAREWARRAALACAESPEAMGYARDIRADILTALNAAPPW